MPFTIAPVWLPYIGFLLTGRKYSIRKLLDISADINKSAFEQLLRTYIKEEIANIDLETLTYDENREEINKILLLFNVLTLNELPDIPQNRFSFYHYRTVDGGWSIEHIHAQNPEDLKDTTHIIHWLEETGDAIANIRNIEKSDAEGEIDVTPVKSYTERIDCLLGQSGDVDVKAFNELKQELSVLFDSRSVHELSNLTLLCKKDNSTLQNFIFPVKREKIIDLEKRGHFIPLCTKMVFLKAYNKADYQPFYWSEKDKEAYFSEIKRIINTIKV
jgi:hypothetical protein